MGRKLKTSLAVVAIAAAAFYIGNASWRVAPPESTQIKLIAHRGVHQTFHRENLDNDTCTATRMDAPTHDYIENTIASMRAAFDAGADIVELDVHPTTDGQFAVFHDWTVDCRTNGTGPTRNHDMASLKALDIGYGYTHDGKTFPFRGKGLGLMPELKEVLAAFPDRRFLVNFKSREEREGDMLADLVAAHPEWRQAVWGAYGGDPPTLKAKDRIGDLHVWSRRGLMGCLLGYIGLGWSGYVPKACQNTIVMVPINVAPLLWGWPNLFADRMRNAQSQIIIAGPYRRGDSGVAGVDSAEDLARVPLAFDGYIWTNKIEAIGPLVRQRANGN